MVGHSGICRLADLQGAPVSTVTPVGVMEEVVVVEVMARVVEGIGNSAPSGGGIARGDGEMSFFRRKPSWSACDATQTQTA